MNWATLTFDWNQARAFLVTAEEGSLSAAARALGMTQPTLGRQVAALEEALGVLLFNRTGRKMTLTPAGLELLDHVRGMGEAAQAFSLRASGQSEAVEGHVTITAGDMTATYFLPRALSRLRDIAPAITVEIVASNDVQDLRRREADIAIRHVRPTQPDLVARKVRTDEGGFYATPEYIARHKVPKDARDLDGAFFTGFAPVERFIAEAARMGVHLTPAHFRITSASTIVLLEVMRRGDAIGILTRDMTALVPQAQQIMTDVPPIPVETWLVSHRELRTNRRMRLVFDLLIEELRRERLSPFSPG